MQQALLAGQAWGLTHRQPAQHSAPLHSRTGCCSQALRVPRSARRPQRRRHAPAAATLEAPETQAADEEQQGNGVPQAAQPQADAALSNGAHSGGLSMEHADKRELYERFFELLSQDISPRYETGDKVVGRVLSVDSTGAYVELNQKAPAYCQAGEMTHCKGVKPTSVLRPGMLREFVVHQKFSDGAMFLTLKELETSVRWKRLTQCRDEGAPLTARVESVARNNGLNVMLMGVEGFITDRYVDKAVPHEDYVGKDVNVRITNMDEETGRLTLAMRIMSSPEKTKNMKVGNVVEGRVTAVKPFGAFVDVGLSQNALIPTAQISADRVTSVGEIFKEGDVVKALIMNFDAAIERVSLSTRRLERQAGDMLRNPAAVYASAEEVAKEIRQRVAEAEAGSGSQDEE